MKEIPQGAGEFGKFLNLPAGFLFALALILGLVIFLPEKTAETLAVKDFRVAYRMYLGPFFLLVVACLVAKTISAVRHHLQVRSSGRERVSQLRQLTPEERGYLAQFILEGKNTIYVAINDGVAGGLQRKGIIYRSSDLFNILEGIAYNLSSWAREELTKNSDLLSGAIGRPLTNRERLLPGRY